MIKNSKFIFLLLLTIGLTFGELFPQSIKVVSASSQGWAGGVCCRSGINYNIQLKIEGTRSHLKLDSLWMEGYCADVSKYTNTKTVKSDTAYVVIQEGVRWDEARLNPNECYNESIKGVVISYFVGGKKKILDITPYIKELDYQAYP